MFTLCFITGVCSERCRKLNLACILRIKKKWRAFVETSSVTALHLYYKQSSGRHKHSSGRSISKATLHFGNLCIYKPSTLRKKPSNFQQSCATNAHSVKHSEGRHHNFLMRTVIVLVQGYRHLVPIATLSSTTSGRVLPTTWSRSTNWEQYAAHHKEFGISM